MINLFNIIFLFYSLEMGVIFDQHIAMYQTNDPFFSLIKPDNVLYVDYKNELIYKYFYISGGITTYSFMMEKSKYLYPTRNDYNFGIGIKYKQLKIGIEHDCFHPIAPNLPSYPLPKLDYSSNRIFIKISSRS